MSPAVEFYQGMPRKTCMDCGVENETVLWRGIGYRCLNCSQYKLKEYQERVKQEKANGTYKSCIERFEEWEAQKKQICNECGSVINERGKHTGESG